MQEGSAALVDRRHPDTNPVTCHSYQNTHIAYHACSGVSAAMFGCSCDAWIVYSHTHEAVHLANVFHLQLGCIPQLVVRFAILQLLPAGMQLVSERSQQDAGYRDMTSLRAVRAQN